MRENQRRPLAATRLTSRTRMTIGSAHRRVAQWPPVLVNTVIDHDHENRGQQVPEHRRTAAHKGPLNVDGDWRASRNSLMAVNAGPIKVIAAYHPAARVTREKAARPWAIVRDVLSINGPGMTSPVAEAA